MKSAVGSELLQLAGPSSSFGRMHDVYLSRAMGCSSSVDECGRRFRHRAYAVRTAVGGTEEVHLGVSVSVSRDRRSQRHQYE